MKVTKNPKVEALIQTKPLAAEIVQAVMNNAPIAIPKNKDEVDVSLEIANIRFNRLGANHLENFDWGKMVLKEEWEDNFAFSPDIFYSYGYRFKIDREHLYHGFSYDNCPIPIWSYTTFLLNEYEFLVLFVLRRVSTGNYKLWILVLLPSSDGAPERLCEAIDLMRIPLSFKEAERQTSIPGWNSSWTQLQESCKVLSERVLRPAGVYGYAKMLAEKNPDGTTVEVFKDVQNFIETSITVLPDKAGFICKIWHKSSPSTFLSFESDGDWGNERVVDFFGSMHNLIQLHKPLLKWGETKYSPQDYSD